MVYKEKPIKETVIENTEFPSKDEDDEDFQVVSPDTSMGFDKEGYSHQLLVMRAFQRVQDALCKEKIEGHNEIMTDEKGISKSFYIPDTRLESIEAIKTLKNTMTGDIIKTVYSKNIEEIEKALTTKEKKYIESQRSYITSLSQETIQSLYRRYPDLIVFLKLNKLYSELPFYSMFINEALQDYRKIFENLVLAIRFILKDYKAVRYGENTD